MHHASAPENIHYKDTITLSYVISPNEGRTKDTIGVDKPMPILEVKSNYSQHMEGHILPPPHAHQVTLTPKLKIPTIDLEVVFINKTTKKYRLIYDPNAPSQATKNIYLLPTVHPCKVSYTGPTTFLFDKPITGIQVADDHYEVNFQQGSNHCAVHVKDTHAANAHLLVQFGDQSLAFELIPVKSTSATYDLTAYPLMRKPPFSIIAQNKHFAPGILTALEEKVTQYPDYTRLGIRKDNLALAIPHIVLGEDGKLYFAIDFENKTPHTWEPVIEWNYHSSQQKQHVLPYLSPFIRLQPKEQKRCIFVLPLESGKNLHLTIKDASRAHADSLTCIVPQAYLT